MPIIHKETENDSSYYGNYYSEGKDNREGGMEIVCWRKECLGIRRGSAPLSRGGCSATVNAGVGKGVVDKGVQEGATH